MAHHSFRARTVMVPPGAGATGTLNAYRALMRALGGDGLVKDVNLKQRYEKPTTSRRRIKYENAKRLYTEHLTQKMAFLLRGERKETPWS